MKEYYDRLGLSQNASLDEIKKTYRRLATKYHPDLNPNNKEYEEEFKKISEAYEILTGKQKPKNNFNNYYNNKTVFKAPAIKLILNLQLEDVFYGNKKNINFTINDLCNVCDGNGGSEPMICNQCGGSGTINQGPFIFICNNCNGSGKLFKNRCNTCNGSGSIKKNKNIDINIPKGITNGEIFIVSSVGNKIKDGVDGDVIFSVNIEPHKIYSVEGLNLKRTLDVSLLDIILGVDKEIDFFEKKIIIKIPKLSDFNKTFRLKGKGFIDYERGLYGDMLVTIKPILPKELNKEETETLESLKNMPNFK